MTGQAAYGAEFVPVRTSVLPKSAQEPGGLASTGSVVNFAQDREVYAEGAPANSFYKVVSGVVRTCKFLNDGRRQIDAFYRAGDIFGIEVSVERHLSAEAVTDCTLICYGRLGVDAAILGGAGAEQLFEHLAQRIAQTQDHVLLLGRRSALERVASFLVGWADRSENKTVATLAMTRQDMADYLGLTIETVSRTLSQLERDHIIAMPSARQIQLEDLEALREMNA
jgi:CRP/FNR family transcriptional regulator, nitrogen fixation regulation protein